MNFESPLSIHDLARRFDLKVIGNADALATGINEIHKVRPGDICFVDHPKYYKKTLESDATIILINEERPAPEGKTLLVCDDPFSVYDTLVRNERPFRYVQNERDASSDIHPTVQIDHNVTIGPDVTIGEGSYIQSGVVIHEHCHIGKNCIIQSGTIIGTDAFYFKKVDNKYQKWRSGGRVIIEDNVDIGANCTINRGVSGDTVVGEGTKIDCLVHVAHGAVIGKHCLIAAQVGIAGKSIIGDHVTLYGQVGVAHGLHIESGTVVYAQSGVAQDLSKGTYFGSPAKDARTLMRELGLRARLPEVFESLRRLTKK